MLKKAVPNLKRWVSGYLVAVITLMLVFNNSFALSALAAETASESNAESRASTSDAIKNSRVTLKNRSVSDKDVDDVQMFVFSDHRDYQPGDTVCLELYIKNNTDEVISDGLLRFKAKGIEEDSAYFEDLNDLYMKVVEAEEKAAEAEAAIKESEKQAEESQEQKEEREAQAAENQEQEGSGEQAEEGQKEEGEASSENQAEQAEPSGEAETAEERSEAASSGSKEAEETLQTAEPETTTREEIDVIGEVSGELDESDTTDNDDTDSEEDEEEEDPTRLTEIEIEPGRAYYVNFYYTIDPEIEKIKDQNVEFTFSWADDDAIIKRPSVTEIFRYTVDGLNLLPVVTGGEKGWVQIGEEDEMLLEFDLGRIEEVLEEAEMEELEKNPEATVSAARRASMSNALIGWDAEDDGKLKGKNDPAVVRNLKLEVETFDVKLNEFKVVPVDEHIDDNFGTTVACKFIVSRKNEPGTHFGRVTASYKIKGKTYRTTQAFCVKVKPEEGEMELTGKIGDAEIVMTGPVESFPKADDLSLKVTEVSAEQQEMVEEALQKKAEEEGTEIDKYKALDIKLIADGEETEPLQDVQVRFKNVNMEKIGEKKAEEEPEVEEKSVAKRMMRKVRSFFAVDRAEEETEEAAVIAEETTVEESTEQTEESTEKTEEKVEGTEEDKEEESSENIKVLHLDEDEIVANEMMSEVLENGDIVMDTDHFSIYILVDMGKPGGQIEVTIEHWAAVETIAAMNNEGTEYLDENGMDMSANDATGNYMSVNDATAPLTVAKDGRKYIDTKDSSSYKPKEPEKGGYPSGTETSYNYYAYDQIFHRDINNPKVNSRLVPIDQIYTPETIKLPNEIEIDAEKLSKIFLNLDGTKKLYNDRGYKIEKIKVQNQGESAWSEYTVTYNNGEASIDRPLILTKDCTMRFEYTEKSADIVYHDVKFYDHNVSDTNSIRGSDAGLNNSTYFINKDKNVRMEAGQNASGNESPWNVPNKNVPEKGFEGNDKNGKTWTSKWTKNGIESKLNRGNQFYNLPSAYSGCGLVRIVEDIVGDELNDDYSLQYDSGIAHPDFFAEKKRADGTYASKLIDNYQLGFIRKGDTYKLTSVKRPGASSDLTNLDNIRYSVYSDGNQSALFSNEFWPLDTVSELKVDGQKPYKGMDAKRSGASDDKGTHNWHFGMRYDFDFTVGDYTGPMNFYFRGDDDFWMFVDKQKVIDLGGIHSAVGKAIDMKAWLIETYGKDTKEMRGTHHVTIYFMERGGYGSCCYMQYTLPNCNSVDIPEVPTMDIEVEKHWKDPNDFLRPEKITVELWRKVKGADPNPNDPDEDEEGYKRVGIEEVKEPVKELGGVGDVWKCSWPLLPKVNPNDQTQKYEYKVKEQSVKGYTAKVYRKKVDAKGNETWFIENTLSPKVKVRVVKDWQDDNDRDKNRPDKVIMRLQYKKSSEGDDKFRNYLGDGGVVTLDGIIDTGKAAEKSAREDREWEGIFTDLPYYVDGEVITYRVCELKEGEEEYPILLEGDKLPGKKAITETDNQEKEKWNYTVSYKEMMFPEIADTFSEIADLFTPINKGYLKGAELVKCKNDGTRVYKRDNIEWSINFKQEQVGKYNLTINKHSLIDEQTNDEKKEWSFEYQPGNDADGYYYKLVVTESGLIEPKEFFVKKQANNENETVLDGTVIMSTVVTNSYEPQKTDQKVEKVWNNMPVGENLTPTPSAEIGLWEFTGTNASNPEHWTLVKDYAIKKEEVKTEEGIEDRKFVLTAAKKTDDNAEVKKQDFIFILDQTTYKGEWNNLPKYKDGKEIKYGVYEVRKVEEDKIDGDETIKIIKNLPIIKDGDIIEINKYKYKVTRSEKKEQEEIVVVIQNTFIPAELKIKKTVNQNSLANEPINTNYKFMIQLIHGAGDKAGTVFTTVALGHDESSKTIYLSPTSAGEKFKIKEIIPMEYDVESITVIKVAQDDEKTEWVDSKPTDGSSEEVLILPGDKVEFIVNNKPTHQEYFHHTASATNEKKKTDNDDFHQSNFQQKVTYKELHGKDQNDRENSGDSEGQNVAYVDLNAILEDKETKWKEREWGEEVAIYG